MEIMKNTLLVYLSIITFIGNVFSQTPGFTPGYVVTSTGDTIRGEVKYKNKYTYTQKVIIKYGDDEKKTLNFRNAVFFASEGEEYELFEVKGVDDKVFLRRYIVGKINYYIYEYELMQMNKIVVKSESYVKAKNSDELIKVNKGNFKKVLSDMMSDNPSLVEKINEKDASFDDIQDFIKQYNAK
jgi:hypothetical protein